MDLTRRAALALPVLLAAGCTGDSPAPEPAAVDPDIALVSAAVQREQALMDALSGLAARSPRRALLESLASDHLQHLQALTAVVLAAALPSPTGSAIVPPRDAPAPSLGTVRRLTLVTERAHATAVLSASPRLAPVLASLAACEASHLVLL